MIMQNAGSRFMVGLMAALSLAVGMSLPAHAALINGGFETGDFTGWTQTGNTGFNGVTCPGPSPTVFAGNCAAFFGPVTTPGGISQTLTNLGPIGTRFTLTFEFLPDGGTPGSFSAAFGGVTLASLTNPLASAAYQRFSFSGTTTSLSPVLAFSFRDDPGFMFLDAVTLSVPEPATVGLLGMGLMGLFFARRRNAR